MSEQMGTLKTVPIAHNCFVRFRCDLCGETIGKIGISGRLLTNDSWIVAEEICPTCTVVGPHGAAERMRQQAASLRQSAEALERVAGEVENITEWATLEDWGRARLRLDAEFRDVEEANIEAWIEEHLPDWVERMRKTVTTDLSEVQPVMAGEA